MTRETDVLVVGAGPAGLASAIEMKRLGVNGVTVVDREPEAGGMPRMCHHTGFGIWDFHRLLSGPRYARRYAELAKASGVEILTSTVVTGWDSARALTYTSPSGVGVISGNAVLLATGVRERPRPARLVPGTRPHGVYTTGSLQRFVYERRLPVGKRAVIVGAEEVSLSAFMTLREAGLEVAAITTKHPRHQMYFPYSLAKLWLIDLLNRTPILTSTRIRRILGLRRVEGVEVVHEGTGRTEVIPCDTVVFTGDWIPENEVARSGDIVMDPGTLGPQVDGGFRASRSGIFAAGNLLHGAETAATSAMEGRMAAHQIAQFLEDGVWPEVRLPVQVSSPILWVYPNSISNSDSRLPRGRLAFRVDRVVGGVAVQVKQGRKTLYTRSFRRLVPNETLHLPDEWLERVNLNGEPLEVMVTG